MRTISSALLSACSASNQREFQNGSHSFPKVVFRKNSLLKVGQMSALSKAEFAGALGSRRFSYPRNLKSGSKKRTGRSPTEFCAAPKPVAPPKRDPHQFVLP